MDFGFLVIADSNGIRRVPIGFLDSESRVISLEFGPPPISKPPPPPAPDGRRRGGLLIVVAVSILCFHLWGPWALVGFAMIFAFLEHLGRQAWSLTQQTQQGPSTAPGRASSPSSV